MQIWHSIHPGCSLYTPNALVYHNEYVIYASTETVVSLDIPRRKQISSFTSSSGITALACNRSGILAVIKSTTECILFQIPYLTHPTDTILLGSKIIDEDYALYMTNEPCFDILEFSGTSDQYLIAVDRRHDTIAIVDMETKVIARIRFPEYLHANILHSIRPSNSFPNDTATDSTDSRILLGGLLTGKLLLLNKGVAELYKAILSKDFQALTSEQQQFRFLALDSKSNTPLPVGFDLYEIFVESSASTGKNSTTMIYLTPGLKQSDVSRSTALSIDVDPFSTNLAYQVLTVYSCGTILLHDLASNPPRLTGRRRIDGARCACFLKNRPGIIAIGFSTGLIKVCNVNVLAKTLSDLDSVDLSINETLKTVVVSRGIGIVILKCLSEHKKVQTNDLHDQYNFLNIDSFFQREKTCSNQPKSASSDAINIMYLIGCTTAGCVFSITSNQFTIHYKTKPGHTESVLNVCHHNELQQFLISVSVDCTAKLWRIDQSGISFESQFGSLGDHVIGRSGKGTAADKANISLQMKTDGGIVNTSHFLGSLIHASWDPRPASCLTLLSSQSGESAIVDIWRGSVYAVLEKHADRVSSNAWTDLYGCICATSSIDGKARIYPFNRSVQLDSPATSFTPSEFAKNYIEFLSNKTPLHDQVFSPHFPLLACASSDGKVHLFDIGYLNMTSAAIRESAHDLNIKLGKTIPVPHLGAFKAHEKACFRIEFHPFIADILATSSTDGTLRIFSISMCAPISVGPTLFDKDSQFSSSVGVSSESKRGQAILRVKAIATLKGHTECIHSIKFHPELPHVLFSGSADKTLRAWNWLAGIELACLSFRSDVHGISISPSNPFEVVISTRDASIHRIHVKGMELGQRAMIHATLGALAKFFVEKKDSADGRAYTLEDVTEYLTNNSNYSSQSLILDAYNDICHIKSERYISFQDFRRTLSLPGGSDLSHVLSLLVGHASKERGLMLNSSLSAKSEQTEESAVSPSVQISPNRIFGTILSLFYPVDSGVMQLMKTFDYLLFASDDVFDANKLVTNDLALQEFSLTDGIVATGPVLIWEAVNMAKLCMKSLTSSKNPLFDVDPGFIKTKYQFYEYTRKQPTLKSEAYRNQFLMTLKLFIALGDMPCIIELLKYLRADDYLTMLFPLLSSREEAADLIALLARPVPPEALQVRMNLKDLVTPLMELIILAQLTYTLTGDYGLIRQACYECCVSGETTLAKILAYRIQNTDLSMQMRHLVVHHKVMEFLAEGKAIKAALELIVEDNVKLACRILALTGEAFLSALMTLSDPTRGDFIGIYGSVELIIQSTLGTEMLELFLSSARGRQATARSVDCYGIYLPKWFTFIHANKILRGLHYIKKLLINDANKSYQMSFIQKEMNSLDSLTIPGLHSRVKSPREFFQMGTEILDPMVLAPLVEKTYKITCHTSTSSIDQAVGNVITTLATEINAFVKGYVSKPDWEHNAIELACLYNLIRGYPLNPSDSTVQFSALLSYLIGGVAALQIGLFPVAHTLILQCTKLLEKSIELRPEFFKIVSLEALSEYKTLAMFCLTGNEALCSDTIVLQTYIQRRNSYLNHGEQTPEILLLSRASNVQAMRSLFTPFTGKTLPLPILTLIPSPDNM